MQGRCIFRIRWPISWDNYLFCDGSLNCARSPTSSLFIWGTQTVMVFSHPISVGVRVLYRSYTDFARATKTRNILIPGPARPGLSSSLTHSLRNFWHPFSRSVRNYFVDARKNHGYGYKNWYISVTNIARHKICTSLDL